MSRLRTWLLAVALLLPGRVHAAEPASHTISVETLVGGTKLVLVNMPGARTSSFRFIVRSGLSADPREQPGLAHVVEHLIFHGSLGIGEDDFSSAVFRAGGQYNGHTMEDLTTYEIDAPKEALLPLAERLITMVSSPTLGRSVVDAEVGVVNTELLYEGNAGAEAIDATLFPSHVARGAAFSEPVTPRLSADDVRAFYEQEYLSSNMVLVFAGDYAAPAVRASVGRSFRLPPALPGELVRRRSHRSPDVPVNAEIASSARIIFLAYQLSEDDQQACDDVADLVSLRLLPLESRSALVTSVDAGCERLRGVPFLVVAGNGAIPNVRQVREAMDAILADVAAKPATAQEQKLIAARRTVEAGRREADARLLVAAITDALARPGETVEGVMERLEHPHAYSPSGVAEQAGRMLRLERRARIQFAP